MLMTALPWFLAFWVGIRSMIWPFSVAYVDSVNLCSVETVSSVAMTLQISVGMADAHSACLSLYLQNPPAEGVAALLISLQCFEDGQVVSVENALSDMTFSYRLSEDRAVILLDASSNQVISVEEAMAHVTVKGSGEALMTVSAVAYTYIKDEKNLRRYDLSTITVPLFFSSDIEKTEEETMDGSMKENETVHGSTVGRALYVGCQETPVHQGRYIVRFLFYMKSKEETAAVYLASATGAGQIRMYTEVASAVTEWCQNTPRYHPTADGGRWLVYTFEGLSDKKKYVFQTAGAKVDAMILYVGGKWIKPPGRISKGNYGKERIEMTKNGYCDLFNTPKHRLFYAIFSKNY